PSADRRHLRSSAGRSVTLRPGIRHRLKHERTCVGRTLQWMRPILMAKVSHTRRPSLGATGSGTPALLAWWGMWVWSASFAQRAADRAAPGRSSDLVAMRELADVILLR